MLLKDSDRFYEILMPLFDWVCKLEDAKNALKDAKVDMGNPDHVRHVLLSFIWEHPERIDQYLAEKGFEIPAQARQVLADWRKHFVPGPFFVERFTKTGAIFISTTDGNVYLVRGITTDIDVMMARMALPCLVYTTLIPYNGCIVYDSSMKAVEDFLDDLDEHAPQLITEIYETAKRYNNIIRRLPPKQDLAPDKQRNIMLEAMMPVITNALPKMTPEEFARQISENPDIHRIQPKDLFVLEKLLDKDFRNPEEWDRIQDILNSGDLFSAIPYRRPKSIKAVEGILCHKGELMVFTTLEKCKKFIDFLHETDDSIRYMNFTTISYEDALDIADQTQRRMVIDIPVKDIFQKCLVYESDKQKLSATLVLRR